MRRLSAQSLDVVGITAQVRDPAHGAVLVFEGVARASGQRDPSAVIEHLDYEAWEGPAERAILALEEQTESRFPGTRVRIVHRTGRVEIGAPAVVVAVGAPHRDAAYAASRHAIDTLKATIPLWKKETGVDGSTWIENHP
jgi:molybdopterin synthase catalytic subunit